MFGRNLDFFAVLCIALVMLGFAQARSWDVNGALDSVRVVNAIQIDRCPISRRILSNISAALH